MRFSQTATRTATLMRAKLDPRALLLSAALSLVYQLYSVATAMFAPVTDAVCAVSTDIGASVIVAIGFLVFMWGLIRFITKNRDGVSWMAGAVIGVVIGLAGGDVWAATVGQNAC